MPGEGPDRGRGSRPPPPPPPATVASDEDDDEGEEDEGDEEEEEEEEDDENGNENENENENETTICPERSERAPPPSRSMTTSGVGTPVRGRRHGALLHLDRGRRRSEIVHRAEERSQIEPPAGEGLSHSDWLPAVSAVRCIHCLRWSVLRSPVESGVG